MIYDDEGRCHLFVHFGGKDLRPFSSVSLLLSLPDEQPCGG